MLKITVDTNVFISGLMKPFSLCAEVIDAFADDKFLLVTSSDILEEFIGVVRRPSFVKAIPLHSANILIKLLKTKTLIVKPTRFINICRDPEDNKMIEAAVAAKANIIVSGDKDLLILKIYEDIPIITPREFINILKNSKT